MRPRIRVTLMVWLLALLLTPMTSLTHAETDYYPTTGWRTSTPEAQGMASTKLQQMNDDIRERGTAIDGVVIIRHGYLVWETYPNPLFSTTDTHYLYSVTKSFTSCLIGIAIDKGYIEDVNQTMLSFFPDRAIKNLDERKQKITVENLLMMRSGMRWDESSAPFTDPRNDIYHILNEDGLQWSLDLAMVGEPGVTWHYNTGASHILSGIVTAATGVSTLRFAEENLFEPLGITRYAWSEDGAGTTIGGFDLQLSPRDMAKFGYLYLHGGEWDGKQIVSQQWVEKSTSTLTKPYATLGYGYQWWTTPSQNMYSCRGLYNQMIYVLPDQDIVIVITGDMKSGGTDSYIADYILASITAYQQNPQPAQAQPQGVPAYPVTALVAGILIAVTLIHRRRVDSTPDKL
jgi:CubicO group peptidase (beta-lactamase class C family)